MQKIQIGLVRREDGQWDARGVSDEHIEDQFEEMNDWRDEPIIDRFIIEVELPEVKDKIISGKFENIETPFNITVNEMELQINDIIENRIDKKIKDNKKVLKDVFTENEVVLIKKYLESKKEDTKEERKYRFFQVMFVIMFLYILLRGI